MTTPDPTPTPAQDGLLWSDQRIDRDALDALAANEMLRGHLDAAQQSIAHLETAYLHQYHYGVELETQLAERGEWEDVPSDAEYQCSCDAGCSVSLVIERDGRWVMSDENGQLSIYPPDDWQLVRRKATSTESEADDDRS